MAFTFRLQALTAPPGAQCLSTLQDTLNKSAKYLQVISPEGLSGIIISEGEPGVDDRDKAWIRLEANDKPRGVFTYMEGWNLVPGVPIGVIMLYSGLVADIPDGYHLCDGTDGTPNLTDNATFGQLWDPAYSAPETEYTLCPIQFVGLAD